MHGKDQVDAVFHPKAEVDFEGHEMQMLIY